ncbi:MAG TPA: potassium-transporting ATPase subunit KdpA [Candidatus Bathyarchaeia archaeon]|nr:potassium-transporting ATPase subunit KdpA [Candidatus Bathyarchaeia archaeon]
MTANGAFQIFLFFGIVLALVKPLGAYMAAVFDGGRTVLDPVLVPVERAIYRLSGVRAEEEQHWTIYTAAMLLFNLAGLLLLYLLQRIQHLLPLNPQGLGPISPDSAFNTAVSFTSNTNWQSYVPETTMSYLVQMVGLTFHNFVSAATGIALAIALVRAFARSEKSTIGNFWYDLVRSTLWVLLPISFLFALVLVWQGVPQNLSPYVTATTVEGAEQTIAQGPVASQESIKELGTNGGGFFNANSAHPYENPTPLSDFLEMVALFSVGSALTYTFGRMVRDQRQGWALFAAMAALFWIGVSVAYVAETLGNPAFARLGVDAGPGALQTGGNMEGKEVRFGVANSALWATVTTDTSCGAVNSMHDSFTPIGGMVPLVNIMLGELIVGGVGSGLYGILVFAVLAVFIAGLMVGRTPEYLGKKIEAKEVTMAVLAILVLAVSILGFTGLASVLPAGLAGPLNKGPHGFSEILYVYTSGTGNNGSAFAGINANTVFYNLTNGLSMLIGRFLMIVPIMAIAGSLVRKKIVPASAGTFPTTGSLYVALLVGTILIVGGLTFFPALALGPIVDHLYMTAGKVL